MPVLKNQNRNAGVNVQEELNLNVERLRLALTAGKIGVWDWNIANDHVSWSRRAYKLHGIKLGEFGGTVKDFAKFIHQEDYKQVINVIQNSVKKGVPFHEEFRVVWPDGTVHWLATDAVTLKDKDGIAKRMLGATFDITERKLKEENERFLSETGKFFAKSLDLKVIFKAIAKRAVPFIADWCSVEIVDGKGKIQLLALAHKDRAKIKWARELRKKFPPDMSRDQGFPRVLRTGKSEMYPYISDEILVNAAKNPRELKLAREIGFTSAIITPLFSNGKTIGAISFVTAESRKRYTKTDLKMAEELAIRASMALENARLYKEAQDAIKLREEFVSIASHELKTPVTSLKMFTQVVRRRVSKNKNVEVLEYMEKMENQIDKLTRLINDLLDSSKVQAGRLEYKNVPYDIVSLVEETIDDLKPNFEEHTIEFKKINVPLLMGDKDKIGQIIVNLLTNAVKYSPKSNKVSVKVFEKNKKVYLTVKDYGIGIDEDQKTKIFERFYRAEKGKNLTFPGLGMGLYISREIARRHGGDIVFKSKKSKGTVFYLSLPIKKEDDFKAE
jgi:PAS domain S-box-containing protein